MRRTLVYTIGGALLGYCWWLVAGCTKECPPCPPTVVDAAPVDAGALDACVCPPSWPTCPPGCTPLDGAP